MRCSSCSKVVKPIVAIDIDGTLGDYHGHLINFACSYLGRGSRAHMFTTYDGTEHFRDWFCRIFETDYATFRAIKLAYRQGGNKRSMPVDEHAMPFVHHTREELGAELWLTTTRPYLRLDNVDPDTRFWLERHGIKFDGMLYDEDKYAVLAEHVDRERVVAVLDDLPEQYDAAKHEFGGHVPILRRNLYNRGVPRQRTAEDLIAAGAMIEQAINDWRQVHGSN